MNATSNTNPYLSKKTYKFHNCTNYSKQEKQKQIQDNMGQNNQPKGRSNIGILNQNSTNIKQYKIDQNAKNFKLQNSNVPHKNIQAIITQLINHDESHQIETPNFKVSHPTFKYAKINKQIQQNDLKKEQKINQGDSASDKKYVEQNARLLQYNLLLTQQNKMLSERNNILECHLLGLIEQVKLFKQLPKINKDQLHVQHIQHISQLSQYPYGSLVYRNNLLTKLVQNLQSESILLTKFKQHSINELERVKKQLQFFRTSFKKQKQQNLCLSSKIQQQYHIYKQQCQNVTKLKKLLTERTQDLQNTNLQIQHRQTIIESLQTQMLRAKDRIEKYKKKAHSYRRERDQIALQMQKAKLQIGTVTLRKYFPEDSDD